MWVGGGDDEATTRSRRAEVGKNLAIKGEKRARTTRNLQSADGGLVRE